MGTSPAGRPTGSGLPFAPVAGFVLVWSSGYIAWPYGVEAMSPLMLVAARFVLAAVVALALARALRGPLRVTRRDAVRIGLSGFVLNGVQFGAMYLAFDAGLGATLASLMHSLSPVLTALLAAAFLGERLTRLQVLGFVIGVGGVLLVLGPDVDAAGGVVGIACGVVSVLGLSIGTLGQRWIGHAPDPLWSGTIQFGVAAPPLLALALVVEGTDVVRDPAAAGIALVYLAVVNSVLGLGLLGILVRAGGAGAAASVFFLMPPVTAVLAWMTLGETLGAREIAGLVITVVGVAAATRGSRPQEELEPA
ncbi:MAG: Permease of the drug/metabolite transporter superfamily [Marmoricola sp.]|nr:Permease of the drug/metabolite transporter superfamily [Marmoricola sp.]